MMDESLRVDLLENLSQIMEVWADCKRRYLKP